MANTVWKKDGNGSVFLFIETKLRRFFEHCKLDLAKRNLPSACWDPHHYRLNKLMSTVLG